MQLCMPQAMKPELSALPITGLTERFQSFKVVPIEPEIFPYSSTSEEESQDTLLEEEPTQYEPVVPIEPEIAPCLPNAEQECQDTLVEVEPPQQQPVVPIEPEIAPCLPNAEQECQDTLVEWEPTQHQPVFPAPAYRATSPRYQRRPPVTMVKVLSKKRRTVSKMRRITRRKRPVVPRDTRRPQVQTGTFREGTQREMEGTVEMQ
ncbi:uncharacterized protein LOC121137579 [Mesocricetus auratus]|uniref:Uncharacterized protein LOC121137579 n=1 Tax=Mesocricetus auratus TaxID=10036 RepID=A0ABM2WZK6_MESAU|nr:uncharacterized protein LOC121137579 [Mesocricetus auratus]